MAELPADLADAVNQQARARVEMNIQGYARYLTPEAVDSLRASFPGIPPRVSRYEIASADEVGSDFVINVGYFEREEPFIVQSRWRKQADNGWMVVHAERIWKAGEKRPGPLSKLAGSVLRSLAGLRRRRD